MLKAVPTDPTSRGADSSVPEAGTVRTLVKAAQRGDAKAFERLYRLHSGKVLGLCLRMLRERDAAEDCVQQTFIKAWRNLDRFESRSAFSTWLHGIAVNVVLSHKRSAKTFFSLDAEGGARGMSDEELDIVETEFNSETDKLDAGDVLDIERALTTLPDGARFVVVLQAIYGYSHEEVSEMLGIAVGTCKAQLHRARRMLRTRLAYAGNGYE